jgi:tRNA pseudouridine65 synthase
LSPEAARSVGVALANGAVDKRYLALVRGAPPDSVRIDHPLSQDERNKPAQPAATSFRTVARYGRYALVEARPETGRTHQIRRHLKHLSCPIIGDVRYGKGDHNRWFRSRYDFYRLALHASSLTLYDPSVKERVTIRAPLPRALTDMLEALARDAADGCATGPSSPQDGPAAGAAV